MEYLVHQLVERVARLAPLSTAVVDGERSLSYGDLDQRSNQIGSFLRNLGVARGDRVALYLEKSLESVVAIYGIMKSGACYVPLDPQAPTKRLAYIVDNCSVACIITSASKSENARIIRGSHPAERPLLILGEPSGIESPADGLYTTSALDAQPVIPLNVTMVDSDLAYILYTSGSTGSPKGVMLSHRNAMAFIAWAASEFAIAAEDRVSSHAPLHFDLSVFDLFGAAFGGATVVLVPPRASIFPPELVRFIANHRISVWYSVPSILSMLVLRSGLKERELKDLRIVLFAGEVFPTKYLRRLVELVPDARFANLYGPTETNVCTWYEVGTLPGDDATIPIGHAIGNDEVFALTDHGRVAGRGELGELFVRGATVMRGYWANPERTAAALVPDPRGGPTVDLVYATGDLVRQEEDGNYHYVGRRDAQVKVRGYRIELGDVESALLAHPWVQECAVVAVPDELVSNRLRAFVVAEPPLEAAELARHCAERTPKYMIPETIEFRTVLPKTSTGKIDRRQLLAGCLAVD